eukprot:364892-Chlamydomonas_euryale.AAC.2
MLPCAPRFHIPSLCCRTPAATPEHACRELLLRENRLLRAQLEQRYVTEKTSWQRAGDAQGDTLGNGSGTGDGQGDRGTARDQAAAAAPPLVGFTASPSKPGVNRGRRTGSRLERARVVAGTQAGAADRAGSMLVLLLWRDRFLLGPACVRGEEGGEGREFVAGEAWIFKVGAPCAWRAGAYAVEKLRLHVVSLHVPLGHCVCMWEVRMCCWEIASACGKTYVLLGNCVCM